MHTLRHVFDALVRSQPDAPLLISPETDRVLTYHAFAGAVAALAARFDDQGIATSDHVGFLLPNGLTTTTIFLGTMIAGRVVVPFNLLSKGPSLSGTLAHSEVKLVFVDRANEATLRDALSGLKSLNRPAPEIAVIDIDDVTSLGMAHAAPLATLTPMEANSPALLMYTSGTTGTPKGAMLTHGNLMHVATTVGQWHGLTAADRVLSSLPLYHINGQCIATIAPFVSGGSIITPHKFSASAWWGWVRTWQPTWLNVVPTIIAYLLNAPNDAMRPFAQVRFARSASAPLPPDQHRAFETRFGIGVIEAMGMTECASMVFCNPQDTKARKYGTPGLPCGVEAKVIAPSGQQLADGETGELCLRGPNVMTAYFNEPDKTRDAFDAQGWLRTGDLGHRDADGFYFVTGRIKELIIKGGENIAPREIDEALLSHPDVLEAAAYALPDVNYGQEVAAAVVLKPEVPKTTYGADVEQALIAHCHAVLGKYKSPVRITLVDELPKGPSGKVQRLKLPELLALR